MSRLKCGFQIDNGFGAAMLAARILRTSAKIRAKTESASAIAAVAGDPSSMA